MTEHNIKQPKPHIDDSSDSVNTSYDCLRPQELAKQVLIKGENKREFFDFVAKMRAEMGIQTTIQEEIFKKYIFSAWKLKRLRTIETYIHDCQNAITDDEKYAVGDQPVRRRIRNIKRIRVNEEIKAVNDQQDRMEKQMVKTLKQLRIEQARIMDDKL